LLNLRRVLGLRSPVNTAGRLLNPLNAAASVDGVFHPPYIDLHLGVAEALGRSRLTVIKGAGGEAERTPAKPVTAHLWDRARGRWEILLPATHPTARLEETKRLGLADFVAVWEGGLVEEGAVATILGTLALALLAAGRAGEIDAAAAMARDFWQNRHAR
jgi:anthranilate phosphoribosyltransferase